MKNPSNPTDFRAVVLWPTVALVGAASLGGTLNRGEPVNSLWFVTAAVCVYALGYRFYSAFVAAKAIAKNPAASSWPSEPQVTA